MIGHLLNETATLSRDVGSVSDGQGGWTPGGVQPVGDIRCRVRSWTSEEELVARQSGIRISHILYTLPDVDIRRGDVVKVRGVTMDVRSVRVPSIPNHHTVVDLEERQT